MTLRGDAAFRYTPPGSAEQTVPLAWPLRMLRPGESGIRHTTWSLRRRERDVVTVDDEVPEIRAQLRYQPDHAELLAMLRHGLDGVTLTYFPSLADELTSYPCELVAVDGQAGGTRALDLDPDRWVRGEFQATLQLRRVDGGTFGGLFS